MAGLGRSWSLATSFDIAFLHCVLAALANAPVVSRPCTAWPLRNVPVRGLSETSQLWLSSLNLLLMQAKCRDDLEDGSRVKARLGLRLLSGKVAAASRTLEQSGFPTHLLFELPHEQKRVERAALPCLDRLALPTARLLGEVFAHAAVLTRRSELSSELRRLGLGLGAAIYLKDALDDYDSDLQKGRFNALIATGSSVSQVQFQLEREVNRARLALGQLGLKDLAELDPIVAQLLPPEPLAASGWQRVRQRQSVAGVCELFLCCGPDLLAACCGQMVCEGTLGGCVACCNETQSKSGNNEAQQYQGVSISTAPPLPPKLPCPACDYPMTCRSTYNIEYDDCERCGGLWLDKGELQALAQAESLPYQLAHRPAPADAPPPRVEGTRACPRCSELLSVMPVRTVRLDFCGQCQGLFLDHGELMQFLKSEETPQDS